jgi:hypothetical protein
VTDLTKLHEIAVFVPLTNSEGREEEMIPHWEISVRPSKTEGAGTVEIRREFAGRLLCAYISEDFREVIITSSSRHDLDRGIATYDLMRPNLPHRRLRIVRDDDKTAVLAAD